MVRRAGWLVIALLLATLLSVSSAHADTQPKNKGLFITPVREYVDVKEGQPVTKKLTVANITDSPTTIALSVEQFSVTDHSYDYEFEPVKEDWIKLEATEIQLQPNKSRSVSYVINIPPAAKPGGHYFTLFATALINSGGVNSKVRAATVLYVTVDGQLQRTGEIEKETVPWILFGGDIPVTLDVKNTGNTHFFVQTLGKLSGWTVKPNSEEVTHILLPGTVRTISSTIAAPLLPGIYPTTYGYKADDGSEIRHSKNIIYIPLWSLAIPLGGLWLLVVLKKRRKNISTRLGATGS